jgi:hypothetical protein
VPAARVDFGLARSPLKQGTGSAAPLAPLRAFAHGSG